VAVWEVCVAKAELGEKQLCPNCGAKFYDLRRRPAICPKCTHSFDPAEESVRLRRSRSRVAAYDPAEEEDEEEAAEATAAAEDEDEEAVEEAPEIDAEADEPVAVVEEDGEVAASPDDLPPGFSETDEDIESDDADDDVPLLEDEEEFPEDEIGELPDDDKDEDADR
jgi:uncharacterized protein (TIGR02300 family)